MGLVGALEILDLTLKVLDAGRVAGRRSRAQTLIDPDLLAPAPQRVRHDANPGTDPQHRRDQRQRQIRYLIVMTDILPRDHVPQ